MIKVPKTLTLQKKIDKKPKKIDKKPMPKQKKI